MKCVICGCTESTPCPGGCAWLTYNPPVCTDCDIDALAAGHITQADIDRWDRLREIDAQIAAEAEPLIIPVGEYEAQRYIDQRRRAMAAGGGR